LTEKEKADGSLIIPIRTLWHGKAQGQTLITTAKLVWEGLAITTLSVPMLLPLSVAFGMDTVTFKHILRKICTSHVLKHGVVPR